LVHLPEHEVERAADVYVLYLPLDRSLFAALFPDFEARIDPDFTLGARARCVLVRGAHHVAAELFAGILGFIFQAETPLHRRRPKRGLGFHAKLESLCFTETLLVALLGLELRFELVRAFLRERIEY